MATPTRTMSSDDFALTPTLTRAELNTTSDDSSPRGTRATSSQISSLHWATALLQLRQHNGAETLELQRTVQSITTELRALQDDNFRLCERQRVMEQQINMLISHLVGLEAGQTSFRLWATNRMYDLERTQLQT